MHDDTLNKRDDLDLLLDAALNTYVDAEAKPGLSHRILTVTSRAEPRRSPIRWIPLAAAALAAVVLIAIVLHRSRSSWETEPTVSHSPQAPAVPTPATPSGPAIPVRSSTATHSSGPAVKAAIAQAAPALPKRDVFPTPTPLTAEEQSVLNVSNRSLETVPTQFATRKNEQPVEPIHIAAIDITPLSPPDKGGN